MNVFELVINGETKMELEDINSIESDLHQYGYKTFIKSPQAAFFIKEEEKSKIVLTTGKLSFEIIKPVDEKDFLDLLSICVDLIPKALKERILPLATARMTDLVPSDGVGAAQRLNAHCDFDFSDHNMNNVMGVGYRFLVKKDDIINEFKIEPYLKDTDMMYVESVFNFKEWSISSVNADIHDAYIEFSNKKDFMLGL